MSVSEQGAGSRDVVAQKDSPSILEVLDEDAVVKVMHAAKDVGALAHLVTTSKQVCRTSRSRVPVHLSVRNKQQADLVIKSQARSGRSFSACTQLTVEAADTASCCTAVGVMGAAQHWPALKQLQLILPPGKLQWQPEEYEEPEGVDLDCFTSSVLAVVPALHNLRRLELNVPVFGTCSAGVVGQLVQLTGLQLYVTLDEAPPDLLALSCLSNLREFKAHYPPAPLPAAGPAGPWCLPRSLTRLELHTWDPEDSPYYMAYWLTHLPGCPQLQHLHLDHSAWQHASSHPSALVPLLSQHNPRLRKLHMTSTMGDETLWAAEAPGLPYAAVPEGDGWRPSAALAALTGLEHLSTDPWLHIKSPADWLHMARLTCLTCLTSPMIYCAPAESAATLSGLLRLYCDAFFGGYDLGLLLLACPLLEVARISVHDPEPGVLWQPTGVRTQLQPHPSLQRLELVCCCSWDRAAQAAEYAALAPVLSSVAGVVLYSWHIGDDAAPANTRVVANRPLF
jgi:hypothetical protein